MRLYELTESFSDSHAVYGSNHPEYSDSQILESNNHVYTFYSAGNMIFLISISPRGNISFASTEATEKPPSLKDFNDNMKEFKGNIIATFNSIFTIIIDILKSKMQKHKTFVLSGKDKKRSMLYKKMIRHPSILERMKKSNLKIAATINDKIYIEREN